MGEFVATIETGVTGDIDDDADRLLTAAEALAVELSPVIATNDAGRMIMLTLWVDGGDAPDVHGEVIDLFNRIWEEAFPDLSPPDVLVIGVRPQDGSRPRPDMSEEEDGSPRGLEAELEAEEAELDAELAGEEV